MIKIRSNHNGYNMYIMFLLLKIGYTKITPMPLRFPMFIANPCNFLLESFDFIYSMVFHRLPHKASQPVNDQNSVLL